MGRPVECQRLQDAPARVSRRLHREGPGRETGGVVLRALYWAAMGSCKPNGGKDGAPRPRA